CFPAIRRLDVKSTKILIISALAISWMSMIVHIYVQLADMRELMPLMYYSFDTDETSYQAYQFQNNEFIRLTPSAQLLSGAAFASSLMIYFMNVSYKRKCYFIAITLTLGLGLIVNITRSTLISTLVISPILVFFNSGRVNVVNIVRLSFVFFSAILFLFAISIYIPD